MARQLGITHCGGGCGIDVRSHEAGFLDPFGVLHFRERRWTRAGAKRFLVLAARQRRREDPEYLNTEGWDWFYEYSDAVAAQRMASQLGFRLPARLFLHEKLRSARLARRRRIPLSQYPKVYAWAHSWQ
jgi:hypothetical protein